MVLIVKVGVGVMFSTMTVLYLSMGRMVTSSQGDSHHQVAKTMLHQGGNKDTIIHVHNCYVVLGTNCKLTDTSDISQTSSSSDGTS